MDNKTRLQFEKQLPTDFSWPLKVNFVIGKDLGSPIFRDIFARFMFFDPSLLDITITTAPTDDAHIYHYHRPQLEYELRSPAVVTVHHDTGDIDPWVNPDDFWKIYHQARRVVCLNSKQATHLADKGVAGTVIIPHGFDANVFEKKLKTFDANRKINIGIVSKRYPRSVKGEAYMSQLFERLSPQRLRLTLVGSGRSLDAEMFRDMGFEVEVFEDLPYRLFGDLYRSLDFLLIPSVFEGGPANVPEALASSTPIISTNVGMAADVIVDRENGAFLTNNIQSDAQLLTDLSKNTGGLTEKLFQGAHVANLEISWHEVISRHVEIYAEIITENTTKTEESRISTVGTI